MVFCCATLVLAAASDPRDDQGARYPDQVQRSVKDVVLAVARNQLHSLSDGKYKQGSWDEVKNIQGTTGVAWNYPWGVTLYGLMRTTAVLGDTIFSSFVFRHNEIAARFFVYLKWMEKTFSSAHQTELSSLFNRASLVELMKLDRLDYCGAMGSQLLEGLLFPNGKATVEEESLLAFVADYIVNKQSRLPDGTFWRPEAGQTLWIDDLYMSCPFLVRWYRYTGDLRYLNDAASQVIQMARRQQDTDGLWYHGNFIAQGKTSPYKWGRGNGWAMVATVEVLSAMPENHPSRQDVLEILRRHINGAVPLQTPSGLWRQVLDHPELWEETSCSAMFAYSIARAVRRGWISSAYLEIVRKAFEGVSNNVTTDGRVNGTCEGTGIGTDLNFYINRRRPANDPHGIGPVLLAGSEIIETETGIHSGIRTASFTLEQNFPNPFNPETQIEYSLTERGSAALKIFNALGQEVKTLVDDVKEPGTYSVSWDGTDSMGHPVPSGQYVYRVSQESQFTSKKAILVR